MNTNANGGVYLRNASQYQLQRKYWQEMHSKQEAISMPFQVKGIHNAASELQNCRIIDSNIEQQCRMIQEQQFEAIIAM
jgi:hypothetical protein